jgi:hypothetical protein
MLGFILLLLGLVALAHQAILQLVLVVLMQFLAELSLRAVVAEAVAGLNPHRRVKTVVQVVVLELQVQPLEHQVVGLRVKDIKVATP